MQRECTARKILRWCWRRKARASLDLAIKPDPERGGFVLDKDAAAKPAEDTKNAQLSLADLSRTTSDVSGTRRGRWGFDSFEGPTFHLRTSQPATWTVTSADQSALIVGRDDTIHLKSDAAVCVDSLRVTNQLHQNLKTTHIVVEPDQ